MTTTQHTPAPWHVEGDTVQSDEYIVCDCGGFGDGAAPHIEANASLIAAAPDMLALLQEINRAFYVKNSRKALMEVMAKTKPLIAKAKGGAA